MQKNAGPNIRDGAGELFAPAGSVESFHAAVDAAPTPCTSA